jgi:hypothetical protein
LFCCRNVIASLVIRRKKSITSVGVNLDIHTNIFKCIRICFIIHWACSYNGVTLNWYSVQISIELSAVLIEGCCRFIQSVSTGMVHWSKSRPTPFKFLPSQPSWPHYRNRRRI